MPEGRFVYDAESNTWSDPDQPELGAHTFETATDGRYYEVGSNVFYRPTGALVGRVAREAGSELTVTSAGVVLLENNIRQRELNTENLSNALYSSTVNGRYTFPSGRTIEVQSDYVNLAPIGERLIVPELGVTDRSQYRTVAEDELLPPGYRLATPRETIARGAIGFLMRNAAAEIRQLAAEGVTLEDGSVTNDPYQVAVFLSHQLDLTATVTYDLSARVGL